MEKKPPAIDKVKGDLRDILSTGDQVEMAGFLNCTSQAVSQRYSRSSSTKPGAYEFLRESWATCSVNEDAGWKLRAYMLRYFDSWLTPVEANDKTVTALIREGHEGFGGLITAKLEGKPVKQLREEIQKVRKAMDQLESALDNEFELRAEPSVTPMKRMQR